MGGDSKIFRTPRNAFITISNWILRGELAAMALWPSASE
jgi:hypothetical protein